MVTKGKKRKITKKRKKEENKESKTILTLVLHKQRK